MLEQLHCDCLLVLEWLGANKLTTVDIFRSDEELTKQGVPLGPRLTISRLFDNLGLFDYHEDRLRTMFDDHGAASALLYAFLDIQRQRQPRLATVSV